ncbi:DUF6372 family protein [Streptomyces sp. NBC_01506]|uniref:DUF6372 family protein n=1 Tax=Streptomyces sp. NBC_01506 TaxID=2903887 RepID=UPI002F908B67
MIEHQEPILTLRLPVLLDWEQDRPGGCRCLCRIFHNDPASTGCTTGAQPGLLLRVETGTANSGPLPVCIGCYTALAPLCG